VQEASIESLVLPAEVLSLALDLGDRLLAEENREGVEPLGSERTASPEVGSPQRIRRAQALGRRHGRDGEGGRVPEVSLGLAQCAQVVVDGRAQGRVDTAGAGKAGPRVAAVGWHGRARCSCRADIQPTKLVDDAQNGGVSARQTGSKQLQCTG